MVRLKTSEEEIFENLMDRRCGLRYRRTPGIKHSKHACKDTKSLKDHSTDPKFKSDDSSEEGKIGNKLLRKEMTHKSKFPKSKFANQFLSCCSSANPEFEDGKYALLEENFVLDLPGTIRKIKDFKYTPEDSELKSKFEEISPEISEIKTKRERVLFKGSRINIEKGETSPGGSEVKTKSEGSLSKRSSTITKFVDESPEEIAEEEDISPKERKVKFESKQTSYFGSTLPEEIDESNIESSPDQSSAEESVLNVTSSTSTVSTDSVSVKSIVENEEWYQKCEHESNIEIAAYVSESDIQKIHHGEKRAENVIEACESHIRSINHDGKLTEKNAEADKNCTSLATGDNIISCSAQIKNSPLSLSQILPAGELSDESTQGSFKSYSEVYEEVKRLQSRMNELDQKINELTSTLSCENLSANKRLENLTGARPKVKLQNERINYEISEPNLVIESTMSEALANIEEVKRTLEVVELDSQEPELYEDQFENLCHNSSTAGLLLLEDSNINQVGSLGSTTRNNERKCGDEEIQRHRKILHWLRKRYSRFEKMLKSIPSKVMK
ncbi:uncharacterized protein [Parasteatoda tepidariorum]|uniref:uncharacterized protein n=1 Tax=Parasteatoda tepidariorum TaxID=114398 RepID=UPI001C71919C|nr:putative leucine-rich repeat-containing protein DDB_G0290503 [Parasteatoda tepidariorum]